LKQSILAIDICSSSIKAVIAKKNSENKISILGAAVESCNGVNKGLITSISVAGESIKKALNQAKSLIDEDFSGAVVSLSGANTKGVSSKGSVNIPNSLISPNEVNKVMQHALFQADIVDEYEAVHVLPMYFKVDDSSNLENPLNMTGSSLEVVVYIITAKKTALANIKSAMKEAKLRVNNFVLNSYASSMAVLSEEQKRFGVGLLDIGSTTSEFIFFKNKAVSYIDFLPLGSSNITNDLYITLKTPVSAAEELKIQYGALLSRQENEDQKIKKVQIPILGDEKSLQEISLEQIQIIVHARIEEMLILMRDKMQANGIIKYMSAGLVLTGGMSELAGVKELASKVFENLPVKMAKPINLKNGVMDLSDPRLASVMGLLSYILDDKQNFELDSNKSLHKVMQNTKKPEEKIYKAPGAKNDDKQIKIAKNSKIQLSQPQKKAHKKSWGQKIMEIF